MNRSPLFTKTLDLLQNCELPLVQVSERTGLGYEWLKKLRAGHIPHPSVNRVQELHDFLVSRRRRN